jgi:D-alanyl-D-alanine dipeptidase
METRQFKYPLLVLLLCTFSACATAPGQALVVTTAGWTDVSGTAQRYQKTGDQWTKVGDPFPIVVGKTGLAWGRGTVDTANLTGPQKHEGDGKAPAGIFLLGTAFGYDASAATDLHYTQLRDTVECVDDSNSVHYNELLDSSAMTKDWNSSEHMHRSDELYRLGIVVEHNQHPAVKQDGSCIFLHIWRGPGQGTVGCTAMEPTNIAALLRWFDPKKNPVLIQMPLDQYRQYQTRWDLPAL